MDSTLRRVRNAVTPLDTWFHPIWYLCSTCWDVETNPFPNLVVSYRTIDFEHSMVLFQFCLDVIETSTLFLLSFLHSWILCINTRHVEHIEPCILVSVLPIPTTLIISTWQPILTAMSLLYIRMKISSFIVIFHSYRQLFIPCLIKLIIYSMVNFRSTWKGFLHAFNA